MKIEQCQSGSDFGLDRLGRGPHYRTPTKRIMAQETKPSENPQKKRVIEFDMFVRDLEPSEEEKVRGGSGSPRNPSENEDAAK